MRLLYPCNPFERKKPDEAYEEEFIAAGDADLKCSLYSAEDFELGDFRPRPALEDGEDVVYRGWMLTAQNYTNLTDAIESKGGRPLASPDQYAHCHYLPEWYHLCEDVTPKTVILQQTDDFEVVLGGLGWKGYFVKDFVKSLTTSRGSVAHTASEVAEIDSS